MFFRGGFEYEYDDAEEYDSSDYIDDEDQIPREYFNTFFQFDPAEESPYYFNENNPKIPRHLRFSPQVSVHDSIIVDWSKWKLPYDIIQYKLRAIDLGTRIECTLYKGKKTKVAVSGLEKNQKYYFIVTGVISETEKINSLESRSITIPGSKKNRNSKSNRTEESKPSTSHPKKDQKKKDKPPQGQKTKPPQEQKTNRRPSKRKENNPKPQSSQNEEPELSPQSKPEPPPKSDISFEPQPKLDTSSESSTTAPPPNPSKSKPKNTPSICKFYLQGKCRHGKSCKLLHQKE